MSTTTTFGIPVDFYFWLFPLLLYTGGYLILGLAFLRWWRRANHWSFGVLALSFLGAATFTAMRLLLKSRASSDDMPRLQEFFNRAEPCGEFVRTVLLFVGAIGFLLASKQFVVVREDEVPPPPAQPTST